MGAFPTGALAQGGGCECGCGWGAGAMSLCSSQLSLSPPEGQEAEAEVYCGSHNGDSWPGSLTGWRAGGGGRVQQCPAFRPRVPWVTWRPVPFSARASAQRPGAVPAAGDAAAGARAPGPGPGTAVKGQLCGAGRGAVTSPPGGRLQRRPSGRGEPRGLRLRQVWGTLGSLSSGVGAVVRLGVPASLELEK